MKYVTFVPLLKVKYFIMDIHEYQGKEILSSYGVKVQRGYVANNPQEAVAAALRALERVASA